MSSSCYFQFKSQKEPTRVTFDGTGISVFELKREIINISKLGDGTDFDLSMYNKDTNEEYDDDTAIVPRSTSVIARRLPASKPGQGRAARYVSGRMPVTAKNAHRTETPAMSTMTTKTGAGANGISAMDKAQTEEERIAAMFQMGADQWEEQKQHMSTQQAVYRPGGFKKPGPEADGPLPEGYVCYRCGLKGHHIRNCPTNNDPKFDGKPRVVRTVGIPRSFLQQIEKPAEIENDGLTDESRQPSSRWVDAEGNAVAAIPDSASWAQYQAKAQASAAKNDSANASGSKELQDRGLECPIDKRLFVDPVKTPCCGQTYCHECIENALINSDLVCPGCSTEGVLFDNLDPDEETIAKIKAYQTEKENEKNATSVSAIVKSEKGSTPAPNDPTRKTKSPSPKPNGTTEHTPRPTSQSVEPTSASKKRPATEDLANDRIPKGPAAMQKPAEKVNVQAMPDQDFIAQMNALAGTNGAGAAMGMPGMPGFPMSMNMGMGMGMMNMPPQMMGMGPGTMMPPFMGMPVMPGMGMNMNMGMPFDNNMNMNMMNNNNMMSYQNGNMGYNNNNHHNNMSGRGGRGGYNAGHQNMNMNMNMMGSFANQQQQGMQGGDSAYMRQPVNPGRAQGRVRKVRPTDYREL